MSRAQPLLLNMRRELSIPIFRLRVEYGPEGGGDPKAIEVYSAGELRELTYEAMDEVLKADISEAELAAIMQVFEKAELTSDHIPFALADSISLSYETSNAEPKSFWGEAGSIQFDVLYEIWVALDRVARRYFIPRFY
jgi:hypothetical protein